MNQEKKLIQINTVCNVSTGHIMGNIQRAADSEGFATLSVFGRRRGFSDLSCVKIGNPISFWLHVALTTVLDLHGMGSCLVTNEVVELLRREQPDIIHLHNIHGYYLNYPILFRYLRYEFKGKIFWTFHDCWPFTGHCAYYTMAKCDKWKYSCSDCPNKMEYPVSLLMDSSAFNFQEKKMYFTGLENLTLIVPSDWMNRQVKASFMKEYRTVTIHNGVDFDIFHYIKNKDIYKKYCIDTDKKIILGVAAYWTSRKGLNDFIELGRALPEEYVIVLVGISKKQRKLLPNNIIGISRTENKEELVRIYSASYIFVNPSIEESFSMVTVEAMACGLPVIVLDTSAVQELVGDKCGVILSDHEAENYLNAIASISNKLEKRIISHAEIIDHSHIYSIQNMTDKITQLYEDDKK